MEVLSRLTETLYGPTLSPESRVQRLPLIDTFPCPHSWSFLFRHSLGRTHTVLVPRLSPEGVEVRVRSHEPPQGPRWEGDRAGDPDPGHGTQERRPSYQYGLGNP